VKSFCAFVIIGLASVGYCYVHRPITYPPGVLISGEPQQLDLVGDNSVIDYRDFRMKKLAEFSIDARVLHRKTYWYDRQAALVPVDLALGWGPMSDQRVLDRLHISQSMRFYWYEYRMPPPIPRDEIVAHSTNVHVIPSTPEIASLCKSLRTGSLIHLTGELVEATGPNIGIWRSSLTRTDTGNGPCELMWVKEARMLSARDSQHGRQLVER
jgi:hypothetical protein